MPPKKKKRPSATKKKAARKPKAKAQSSTKPDQQSVPAGARRRKNASMIANWQDRFKEALAAMPAATNRKFKENVAHSRLGFSASQYHRWMSGESMPSVDSAARLCEEACTTMDWVFRRIHPGDVILENIARGVYVGPHLYRPVTEDGTGGKAG